MTQWQVEFRRSERDPWQVAEWGVTHETRLHANYALAVLQLHDAIDDEQRDPWLPSSRAEYRVVEA